MMVAVLVLTPLSLVIARFIAKHFLHTLFSNGPGLRVFKLDDRKSHSEKLIESLI